MADVPDPAGPGVLDAHRRPRTGRRTLRPAGPGMFLPPFHPERPGPGISHAGDRRLAPLLPGRLRIRAGIRGPECIPLPRPGLSRRTAAALGRDADARERAAQAEEVRHAFNTRLYDPKQQLFIDHPKSKHAGFHAKVFAVAFGSPTRKGGKRRRLPRPGGDAVQRLRRPVLSGGALSTAPGDAGGRTDGFELRPQLARHDRTRRDLHHRGVESRTQAQYEFRPSVGKRSRQPDRAPSLRPSADRTGLETVPVRSPGPDRCGAASTASGFRAACSKRSSTATKREK